MSQFHTTLAGERLALKFHRICAYVGGLHILLGSLMIAWHAKGAEDHRRNMEKLRGR